MSSSGGGSLNRKTQAPRTPRTPPERAFQRRHNAVPTFESCARSAEKPKPPKKSSFWNRPFLLMYLLASAAQNCSYKTPKLAYAVLERLSPRNHAKFRPPFEISEDYNTYWSRRADLSFSATGPVHPNQTHSHTFRLSVSVSLSLSPPSLLFQLAGPDRHQGGRAASRAKRAIQHRVVRVRDSRQAPVQAIFA